MKNSFKDLKKSIQNEGRSDVSINGHPVAERLVKMAEKQAGPIRPGNYWYQEILQSHKFSSPTSPNDSLLFCCLLPGTTTELDSGEYWEVTALEYYRLSLKSSITQCQRIALAEPQESL
jgi:hypothetical protein